MNVQKCSAVFFAALSLFITLPLTALAHQPRIVESRETQVTEPEVSKAFYGTLSGAPDVFIMTADAPFNLYVNVLVPALEVPQRDVSADILRNGERIARLESQVDGWEKFYEPFGADYYWKGPEYENLVPAGTYEVRVFSPSNQSNYALAIGKIEAFGIQETITTLALIPTLKRDFFDTSPVTFITSPLGYGLISVLFVLAFIAGLLYRAVLTRFATGARAAPQNIGRADRILRLVLAIALFVLAITTNWSPILIFFSGFALFEAIFSWCGFYAAIGKNTCGIA
ncbi:DUF2892 domain-containing protein [Patescibacteria group bacterium]|nr:DUF2892 domain-containing protein [Patescibacteria group bacterium]